MFFGEFLIDRSFITRDQLQEALTLQKKEKLPIGQTLVQLGYLPADRLDELLEAHILICADKVVSEHNEK